MGFSPWPCQSARLVQAASRLRDSTIGGAVLIPQWTVASPRKQGLGLSKLAPPCSLHPSAMQGAHQLSLHQPFIFRFEFDFNHYLADSISSHWMKGPRGEEEGKQCSLSGVRSGLLLRPSCPTKKWGPRNTQRAYPSRTSIFRGPHPVTSSQPKLWDRRAAVIPTSPVPRPGRREALHRQKSGSQSSRSHAWETSALNGPFWGGSSA